MLQRLTRLLLLDQSTTPTMTLRKGLLGMYALFFFMGKKLGVFQIKLINTYGAPVLCARHDGGL